MIYVDTVGGTNRFEGRVTFDAQALGLAARAGIWRLDAGAEPVFDARSGWRGLSDTAVRREALDFAEGASVRMEIPPHDFRVIQVE